MNIRFRWPSRHSIQEAELPTWVDSCPCYFPYIESVPTSEFGATTDVRQAAGYDIWLAVVLPKSATMRHSRRFWEGLRCRKSRRSCQAICSTEKGHKKSLPVLNHPYQRLIGPEILTTPTSWAFSCLCPALPVSLAHGVCYSERIHRENVSG